jgi:hypothetical protein
MSSNLLDILNYEVNDEVWWFKIGQQAGCLYSFALKPGDIELVHDTIKEIKDGMLICWHTQKRPSDVWGKTRNEAWATLRRNLEHWGKLP